MYRSAMILLALAIIACATVPAMAVNWVLTDTVPGTMSVVQGNDFSGTADMPSWATFTGTAIPDMRVTYHVGAGNYGEGNSGLALWLGATPSATTGLFGGRSGQWFALQNIGLGNSGNYTNYYPFAYDSNMWSYLPTGFDTDMQVVTTGGVTTVTLAVTNTDAPGSYWADYPFHTDTGTFDATSSRAAWAGNSKLAAFMLNGNVAGFGITVSDIKFYRSAADIQTGAISGVVHLNGTTPGAGVTVSIPGSGSTTTGTDGTYSFPTVMVGTHTMVAHLFGYADQTVPGVVVQNSQTTTQNFKLAGGKISGSVTMAGGAPVVGATVRTADSAYTTTTGTNGSYSLQMPPGTYDLVCSRSLFADATATGVVVNDEQTTTRNFTMALNLGTGQAGIVGRATSSLTGQPIVGATVRADTTTTTTDALGNYVLIVTAGEFEEFGAQATYFDSQIAGLTIASGDTIVRNFSLVHMTTWDLSAEFSTAFNPNGQWSFGPVNSGVMTPYSYLTDVGLMGWTPGWKVWTVGGDQTPAFGMWFGKNTTGAPIVVNEYWDGTAYRPELVVENGDTSYGGQWCSYGRSSLRWSYPYSDQRFMNIHIDMKNQYVCGGQQMLKMYQNNGLLTSLYVNGYAGFAGTAANGYADSLPAKAGTPTLAYDTALLLNPGDVIDFSNVGGSYVEPYGYRTSIGLGVVISPGSGVALTSLGAVLARAESLTTEIALTAPVVAACALMPANGNGGFSDYSFYVQSPDRTVGMKCLGSANLIGCAAGDRITMNGKVTHDASGQKVFLVDMITSRVAGTPPNPIGIGSKGVTASTSPRNMLVKVWGKLTQRNPADIGTGPFYPGNPFPWNYWIINDGGQDIKLPLNVQSGAMCPDWLPATWAIGDYISVTGIETLDSTGQVVILPREHANFVDYTASGF